jgi:hypothetical protein
MQLAETNEEIAVPQMVNLDALTKIIVAFSKAGGDKTAVPIEEVAQISGVNQNNVSLNNKFFVYMGLVEGKRGSYKLTTAGAEYAKALDWGRLEEAQSILKKIIKDNPFVQKTVSYVDLNKPVSKDDLIAKVAGFAGVSNEPRFSTGIKAFVEMLSLSGILKEDKDGMLISGLKDEPKVTVFPDHAVPDASDVQKRDFIEKGQPNGRLLCRRICQLVYPLILIAIQIQKN